MILHNPVGSGAQARENPVARLFVRRCVGDARSEGDLLLDIGERSLAVELTPVPHRPGVTRQQRRQARHPADADHLICPTLVEKFTNAVMMSCAVLWFVCRSSFTR